MQDNFDFDFTQLTDFDDTQTQGGRQETPSPAAVLQVQPQKFSFKQSGGGRQWRPPTEPNAASAAIDKVQPVQPIAPQGFKPNAAVNKWKPIVQREEESVEPQTPAKRAASDDSVHGRAKKLKEDMTQTMADPDDSVLYSPKRVEPLPPSERSKELPLDDELPVSPGGEPEEVESAMDKWKHCTHEEWVLGGQDILRRLTALQNEFVQLQMTALTTNANVMQELDEHRANQDIETDKINQTEINLQRHFQSIFAPLGL